MHEVYVHISGMVHEACANESHNMCIAIEYIMPMVLGY